MPMSDVPTATEPRGRRKPDWVAQFEGQMLVCGLLAKALYGAPDRDWLGGIVARRLFEEIPFGNALPEIETARDKRTAERSVGKECVIQRRTRWSPSH